MGLAFSRSPKLEFNLPFSCYLLVLFYVVRLTRLLPGLLMLQHWKRAGRTRDLKFGRHVVSAFNKYLTVWQKFLIVLLGFLNGDYWFFHFLALLSVLAWPDNSCLVLGCFLVPHSKLLSGERLRIPCLAQVRTSPGLCVYACTRTCKNTVWNLF